MRRRNPPQGNSCCWSNRKGVRKSNCCPLLTPFHNDSARGSKAQTTTHAALIAGFVLLDGAGFGFDEFQQVAKHHRRFGNIEFLLAGVGFVTDACPRCEVFRWRGLGCSGWGRQTSRGRYRLPHGVSDHFFQGFAVDGVHIANWAALRCNLR